MSKSNVIPKGGKYIQCREHEFSVKTLQEEQIKNDIIFTEGQEFPAIKHGDIFILGDYEYRYNEKHGWDVKVLNNLLESYEEIIAVINGKKLKIMTETFRDCYLMKKSPKIPPSVIEMYATFSGCSKLKVAPEIPQGIKSMVLTFDNCFSLLEPPVIPDTVKDITQCFNNCNFEFKRNEKSINDLFNDLI